MASRSPSMSSPPYKISPKSTDQFKSFTHLRSFNVCHFGMAEAMGLEDMTSRPPSMSPTPYKISFKSSNWFKSLNIHHFGMIKVTFNDITSRKKFHSNPPMGSRDVHTSEI
jgi:hypothetical protein